MSCEGFRPDLVPHLRAELPPDRADEVGSHLRSCAACTAVQGELREVIGALSAVEAGAPPKDLKGRVLGAVEEARLGPLLRAAMPEVPSSDLKSRALAGIAGPPPLRRPRAVPVEGPRPARWVALAAAAASVAALLAGAAWMRVADLQDRLDFETRQGAQAEEQLGPTGHELQTFALRGSYGALDARLTHYRHDNFRLGLEVVRFLPTPGGHHYAVWLSGERGDQPVGSFRLKRSDRFLINFAIAVDPADYPQVLVTLERNDGKPTRDGALIARGRLDPERVHYRH